MYIAQLKLTNSDAHLLYKWAEYFTEKGINLATGDVGATNPFQKVDLTILSQIISTMVESNCHTYLIEGVPVPNLEPTPHDTKWRTSTDVLPSDVLQWAVGELFRGIRTYTDEHNGHSLHNICCVNGHEKEQSSSGNADFLFHCEVPQLGRDKPDWVSLMCLRGSTDVTTGFLESKDLIRNLPLSLRRATTRPCMDLRINDSFDNKGTRLTVPIYDAARDAYTFDSVEMQPMEDSNESMELYSRIMGELERCQKTHHVMEAGQFVLFNNQKLLHSRAAPKGTSDRWLTRAYY